MTDLTRRFRTIHGYKRAYIRAGTGPALLLIHGIGDNADSWAGLIPTLAESFTVIAPDLLGHGESDKPRADYSIGAYANAMRDLLSVLDVERVTVLGHSLGGGVAMQFAYQYPERCERLVLVGTGGVSHEVNPVLRFVSAPNADLVLPLLGAPGARLVGHAVFAALKALDTDIGHDAPQLMRIFDALPNTASRRAFVRTLRGAVDWRGQAITMLDRCYLAQDMPTLVVWGSRDGVIPVKHAARIHAAMPASQLEIFENAGHFPHQDDPARFLRVFHEFYAGTTACQHSAEEWRALLRRGVLHALRPADTRQPVAV
ncbi:MAG: alpha/beta fold hydrolase [Myxococcales bacterium]|nr:alpha/beta fold hydrolase [Myxococcales bacterium]